MQSISLNLAKSTSEALVEVTNQLLYISDRYDCVAENAALDDRHGALEDNGVRPSRFGLSNYTSKRLADLRARRAEMDQSDDPSDFQQKGEVRDAPESSGVTSRIGGSTSSDGKQDERPAPRRRDIDIGKTNNGADEGVSVKSSHVSIPALGGANSSSTTVSVSIGSYRSRQTDPPNDVQKSIKTSSAVDSNKAATKKDDVDHTDSYRIRRATAGVDMPKSGTESGSERYRSGETGYSRVATSSLSDSTGKNIDSRRDVQSTVTSNGSLAHGRVATNGSDSDSTNPVSLSTTLTSAMCVTASS